MHDRADAAVVQTAAFMEHSSVAVKPAQEGKTARLYNWLDAQPWKDWTRASRIAENPELLYKEPAYNDTGIPLELAISVYPTQFVFDTAGSDGGGAVDSEGMLATESDQDSIPMRVRIAAITKAVIESNADTVIARYDTLNALTPSKLDELVARATLAETSAKAALDTANRSKVDEDIEEARKTHANAMAITKILYAKQRQPKKRSVPAGGPAAGPKRAKTPTDPTDQDNVQRGLESVKDFIAEIVSGGVAEVTVVVASDSKVGAFVYNTSNQTLSKAPDALGIGPVFLFGKFAQYIDDVLEQDKNHRKRTTRPKDSGGFGFYSLEQHERFTSANARGSLYAITNKNRLLTWVGWKHFHPGNCTDSMKRFIHFTLKEQLVYVGCNRVL